eukprot:g2044.t1
MASTLIAVASKPKSDGLQQPAKYILPPGRYLQELCAAGELGNCRVLVLQSCHGYGLALSAALSEVATEFVLVVQHDWLFVRDVDLTLVVDAMDKDPAIKYIGMQSLTTLDYARRMQLRWGLVIWLRLVPQLLWYDKPHLCRKRHYVEVVLPEANMTVLENPERRYGVERMWPKLLNSQNLAEDHLRYGTFFWDVGAEVVYHLSGRKLLAQTNPDAEKLQVEGLRGVPTLRDFSTVKVAAGRLHEQGTTSDFNHSNNLAMYMTESRASQDASKLWRATRRQASRIHSRRTFYPEDEVPKSRLQAQEKEWRRLLRKRTMPANDELDVAACNQG